jgi:hypothetical protein
VTEFGEGAVPKVRRRRTRRHRRNRLIRRLLAFAAITVCLAGASALALRYLSPSLFRAQSAPPTFKEAELSRDRLITLNELLSSAPSADRPVYPYSVIPGGVEDARELKWIAEHDPVVAAHYAGFDYDHAKVVRLTLARTVYLSYRIGNHVYWTRHRITLHKGEKVITDGRMTARIRCANRVEDVPQHLVSPMEPPEVAFDQPSGTGIGTAMQQPPVPFQTALVNHAGPGLGPVGPLGLYDPLGGGGWTPISPPPVPAGLCKPGKKPGEGGKGCCPGEGGIGKGKTSPCRTGEVPEPATWILFVSGLAAIYWQARRRMARASLS